MTTLTQATNKIQKLGGYAKIPSMPFEQQTAYAAEQLGTSLALNAAWLFKQAMIKSIDLYAKLREFDEKRATWERSDIDLWTAFLMEELADSE